MKITAFLLTSLTVSEAWNLQSPRKLTSQMVKGCAAVATCAALLSPINAHAADETAFKVDIDTPYLLNLVKTDEARTKSLQRAEYLAEAVKGFLGPAVSLGLPTDIEGLIKDSLSGEASLSINGQEIAARVVGSEQGRLTVQLANEIIPAVPFAGLENTQWPVGAEVHEASSFQVEVNTPYLLDLVRTGDVRSSTIQRIGFLAESVKDFLGPAVSVELPSDIQGLVKDSLAGKASIVINGEDVGIKIVGSEAGRLTVQLSNDLLPAIPFAGLESTPWLVNAAVDTASKAAPVVVEKVVTALNGEPFWEKPIFDGAARLDIDVGSLSYHKALNPVDVAGIGSAALGGVYATSYGWYVYSNKQEQREAEAKKAERQAAAVAKKAAKKAAELELPEKAMTEKPLDTESSKDSMKTVPNKEVVAS